MVPRDGVEPPTPAFSGLESLDINWLIPLGLSTVFPLETPRIPEW